MCYVDCGCCSGRNSESQGRTKKGALEGTAFLVHPGYVEPTLRIWRGSNSGASMCSTATALDTTEPVEGDDIVALMTRRVYDIAGDKQWRFWLPLK